MKRILIGFVSLGIISGANAAQLEEVVVTAQKRSEDVRDVPIAISVFSGDDMRDAAISNFNDLALFLPNVSINTDFNALYLRGIGTSELNVIGEQSVAYIIDGVYVSRLDYLKPGFMDLERIEILKGPQGTLFGRNATGGVINISNGTPTEEMYGLISATTGDRGITEIEGILSGPLTDSLRFRLAGKSRKEDGATYSVFSEDTLGDKVLEQARATLVWDISDTLSAKLSYTNLDYDIGVWLGTEISYAPDDQITSLLDPDYDQNLDRRSSLSKGNQSKGSGKIVPLELNWELGEFVVTLVSAITELNDVQGGDIDATNADYITLSGSVDSKQWSEELRLTSPPGVFEYVAGLYYYESTIETELAMPLFPAGGGGVAQGLLGSLTGGALDSILAPIYASITQVPVVSGPLDTFYGYTDIDTTSIGVFGQGKWNVSEHLALILGLRYSEDEKIGSSYSVHGSPLPLYEQLIGPEYSVLGKTIVDRDVSPKLSVIWDPLEEVSMYFTYAEGFRSGSFNIAALSEDEVTFDAENSITMEAGIKTELFGGSTRWNFGAFHTSYYDYQLATFTGFGYATANAAEVVSKGIETDITTMPIENLLIVASAGYNIAEFEDFKNGGCQTKPLLEDPTPTGLAMFPEVCDLSGKPIHRAPELTGSLRVDYTFSPFNLPFNVVVGADASYKGFEYMDSDLDPIDSQDAYWLINARVGVESLNGRWRVEVHGKNLSDELVKTFSGDAILQPGSHAALSNSPKYYFATLRYTFN
jgi:outer membrane receptor protein involved in Fe transport